MIKIPVADYRNYISWAAGNSANRVYPLSIAEGFQAGEIFVDDLADTRAVFFWHYCGFGYISGEKPSEVFLREIYERMLSERSGKMVSESGGSLSVSGRRLVLITDDEAVIRYFRGKEVHVGLRAEYRYPCAAGVLADPVAGSQCFAQIQNAAALDTDRFRIERIDGDNIAGIRGRIVPSFSWEGDEQFLEKGFGFVAIERDGLKGDVRDDEQGRTQGDGCGTVCAVTFSAAVSSDEVDIGIETREESRGNGLAAALAARMCEEIVAIGKRPVWAHATSNVGSMKTALRCGFVVDRVNKVIKK